MNEVLAPDQTIDVCGEYCPAPMLEANRAIKKLRPGQVLEVLATDRGALMDIPAWCERTRHRLLHQETEGDVFRFLIQHRDA